MLLGLCIDDISYGKSEKEPGEVRTVAQYQEILKPFADAGFTRMVPCLRHWERHWAKTNLRSKISPQLHGAFERFLQASTNLGMDMYPWSCCFIEPPSSEFLKLHPECHSVSRLGNKDSRLCRSQPIVQEYETNIYKEFLDFYPGLKGIVLDFIRFNEFQSDCYCDHCLSEYKRSGGSSSREDFGFASQQWAEWRCGVITQTVKKVADLAQKRRVELSAAVFPDWPHCRNEVGQDWGAWCKDGLLDDVMPMTYSNNPDFIEEFTRRHVKAAAGKPVYELLGVDSLTSKLSDDEVGIQARRAIDAGAKGLVFYVGENPRKPTWLKKLPK